MVSFADAIRKSSVSLEEHLKEVAPYRTGALMRSVDVKAHKDSWTVPMFLYGAILDKHSPKWEGWISEGVELTLDEIADNIAKNIAKQL